MTELGAPRRDGRSTVARWMNDYNDLAEEARTITRDTTTHPNDCHCPDCLDPRDAL